MEYLWAIVVVVVLFLFLLFGFKRITILEYEKGLYYSRGKFKAVIGPGQYWYMPFFTILQKLDIRPAFVSILGQEVLSADGVTLKASLAANYEIIDPSIAINKVKNYNEVLYLELQLVLREIIGSVEIDVILAGRHELSQKLMEKAEPKIKELGLRLISVNLKDIMFPGKLKDIFAQVVSAKKEGLAALEKARGETAALRCLANAAKMMEDNPNLIQLRLLQTLGESTGNTMIFGMPSQAPFIPVTQHQSIRDSREKTTDES